MAKTIKQKRLVVTPIHPGEYLKDELDARNLTQTLFASHIGVSGAYLSDIVNGRRGLSALMAVKIGKALSVDPQTWLNLQMRYDLDMVNVDEVDVEEIAA